MLKHSLRFCFIVAFLACTLQAAAAQESMTKLGEEIIETACTLLNVGPQDADIACITNAGCATMNGKNIRMLPDVVTRATAIGQGKGNLLLVHERKDAAPWMAFVAKKSANNLQSVYFRLTDNGFENAEAVNVYVNPGTSFEPFQKVFGKNAFSIVTFANGWADGIPRDLMDGSLFHDHLCCGVFTGYFTVGFIRKNLPLQKEQRYIYIGAPAWCQDDYIMHAMNLTPGKHGYYTMGYPWSRPWKNGEKIYRNLGGIVVRQHSATGTGTAHLLSFNWRPEEFKAFVGMPDLKLDWRGSPWLHVVYNRFFLSKLDQPEHFISVIKSVDIKDKEDLKRLTDIGANPLEVMLGPDET